MKLAITFFVVLFVIGGCVTSSDQADLVAQLEAKSDSDADGIVQFSQTDTGVLVEADVSGLSEGLHGFHIHEKGDCSSEDANSAGGHFNPTSQEHGSPDSEIHHMGDLGNIHADESGHVRLRTVFSLDFDQIKGRAVVIHADADDFKSQPSGAAGARVACGVIGSSTR